VPLSGTWHSSASQTPRAPHVRLLPTVTVINQADRPISSYAVKPGDVATNRRLYRGASTSDADGSVLITPESGQHSPIPPEAVEICYDGHLQATSHADIQRTPPC
jgi:hypothetical protein